MKVRNQIGHLDEGQAMVEYALLFALLILVILVTFTNVVDNIYSIYQLIIGAILGI